MGTKLTVRKIWLGHFWYTFFLGPRPPPPPPLSTAMPPRPPPLVVTLLLLFWDIGDRVCGKCGVAVPPTQAIASWQPPPPPPPHPREGGALEAKTRSVPLKAPSSFGPLSQIVAREQFSDVVVGGGARGRGAGGVPGPYACPPPPLGVVRQRPELYVMQRV